MHYWCILFLFSGMQIPFSNHTLNVSLHIQYISIGLYVCTHLSPCAHNRGPRLFHHIDALIYWVCQQYITKLEQKLNKDKRRSKNCLLCYLYRVSCYTRGTPPITAVCTHLCQHFINTQRCMIVNNKCSRGIYQTRVFSSL